MTYMAVRRFALALDLKEDPELIAAYEASHREIWPEILDSLEEAGILRMDIYRILNRLFMVLEVSRDFSFERKAVLDAANPTVQRWEALMGQYQQSLPLAKPGEKWMLMDSVFTWKPDCPASESS